MPYPQTQPCVREMTPAKLGLPRCDTLKQVKKLLISDGRRAHSDSQTATHRRQLWTASGMPLESYLPQPRAGEPQRFPRMLLRQGGIVTARDALLLGYEWARAQRRINEGTIALIGRGLSKHFPDQPWGRYPQITTIDQLSPSLANVPAVLATGDYNLGGWSLRDILTQPESELALQVGQLDALTTCREPDYYVATQVYNRARIIAQALFELPNSSGVTMKSN